MGKALPGDSPAPLPPESGKGKEAGEKNGDNFYSAQRETADRPKKGLHLLQLGKPVGLLK